MRYIVSMGDQCISSQIKAVIRYSKVLVDVTEQIDVPRYWASSGIIMSLQTVNIAMHI